jgi:hypothetical protein
MQALELINTSVVVIANEHNPTVLNPDFLNNTGIVLKEWDWALSESPITTPAFSSVKYNSGISITVEPGKLQIMDELVSNPVDSKYVEVAKKYIAVLEHVQYKAIGVNFDGVISMEAAKEFVKQHFLRGDLVGYENMTSAGVRLVYPSCNGNDFTLKIDPAMKLGGGDQENADTALLVKGNFNRICPIGINSDEIVNGFPDISVHWEKYLKTLGELLG